MFCDDVRSFQLAPNLIIQSSLTHISFLVFFFYPFQHQTHKWSFCGKPLSAQTWSLPMADPEHRLTRLLRRELWTWGPGVAWQHNKTHEASGSPLGPLGSSHCFITVFSPSFLPFHLQSIAGSKLLSSGNTVNKGWEAVDGADMGKGRVNFSKTGGFHSRFKEPF